MTIGAGCHPNKVKVSGPGVAKTGLKAFEPTYFTVDCAEAGQGMTIFILALVTFLVNQFVLLCLRNIRYMISCLCR